MTGSSTTGQPASPPSNPPATTPTTPSASYINLPPPGDKKAPLRFKGKKGRSVERFIKHYAAICAEKNVTDSEQKCLGLIQYCSDHVAETLEHTRAFQTNNYDVLIKEIERLYDGGKKRSEYHRGDLDKLVEEWRRTKITTLKVFNEYTLGARGPGNR